MAAGNLAPKGLRIGNCEKRRMPMGLSLNAKFSQEFQQRFG